MNNLDSFRMLHKDFKSLKIAIVHEWFVNYAGSERVVEQMLEVFPQADLFALVDFLPEGRKGFLKGKKVKTTFIQNLPWSSDHFRNYFPLFPMAVESHDLRGYDLIISSSHMVSKGLICNQNQLHICYCHSPCRYAWDLFHQYLEEAGLKSGIKGVLAQYFLHRLRSWDIISVNRVGHFIANSAYIGKRIKHVYQRDFEVVYPPVDVAKFTCQPDKGNYYFAASRLVPYKKMDLIARAFQKMPDKKLIIVGSGKDESNIRGITGANIEFRTEANSADFTSLLSSAKAFIFAAEEDFGITMAEAQACGTPVIAFARGGAAEIVIDGKSGYLFREQTVESLTEAVQLFEKQGVEWGAEKISDSAHRFSNQNFRTNLLRCILNKWEESGK